MNIEIDKIRIDHLNDTTFIAGKVKNPPTNHKQPVSCLDETKPVPMGIGKKGTPEIEFLRSFRWILESSSSDIMPFNQKIEVDYIGKIIVVYAYEVYENDGITTNIENWKKNIYPIIDGEHISFKKEDLTLTTLDGCGNRLYNNCFKNVELQSHEIKLDYSLSEALIHKFVFKFNECSRYDYRKGKKND